jgi:acyl carrier protein
VSNSAESDEIRGEIRRFLLENSLVPIDAEKLTGDLDIFETGIADSVLILDLTSFLEERFEMTLSPNEIVAANFATLDNLVYLVSRHRPVRHSSGE